MEQAIEKIDELINTDGYHYVVTPNVDHIITVGEDRLFKEIYCNADLVLTDGMPLVWISRLKKNKIIEKVSGSDIFPKVCEMAALKNYKVFLLGAADGVAAKAAENLNNKYKGLNVCGTYSPPYGFEKDQKEINKIIELINTSKPHILAVGLGSPKQEKFIYNYINDLKVPISLAIGASIDFEAGNVKRAPVWMQKSGLEWFYRFIKEPRRLFHRYFIRYPKFLKYLVR
jgi:exopolysaccharide biosynthesis WecB/TagA/CpsF family protein